MFHTSTFSIRRSAVLASVGAVMVLLALAGTGPALAAPASHVSATHPFHSLSQHAASVARLTPTCSGTGCDGSDPYATGCAGPLASYYVAASVPLNDSSGNANWSYGYVQIWWSITCQTNWGRIVVSNGTPSQMWIQLQGNYQPSVCGQGQSPACNGQTSLVSPQYYLPSTTASAFGSDTVGFSHYSNSTPWV